MQSGSSRVIPTPKTHKRQARALQALGFSLFPLALLDGEALIEPPQLVTTLHQFSEHKLMKGMMKRFLLNCVIQPAMSYYSIVLILTHMKG